MGTMRHLWAKRRKTVLACLGAALAVVAFSGYKAYTKASAPPSFESPRRGDIETRFKETGEIAPKNFVDVASKVSGRVLELKVSEGAAVRKGQPLAVIQPGRTESERYVPSTLAAPIAGTVMRYVPTSNSNDPAKFPRVGDYATGLFDSQTPTYLMTVADLSRMIVKMQISEMDILKLSPGMAVSVDVDALPGRKFAGRVSLISPQAEKNQAGLKVFKVEVELSEADARLKPGMTARVDALLDSKKGALKVPLSAVFEEGGREHVFVEVPRGKPRRIEVTLGLRSEMEAEVLNAQALSESDRLLTDKPEEGKARKW